MTFSFSFKKGAVSTEPGVSSHFCSRVMSSPPGPRRQQQAREDPGLSCTSAHGPSVLLQASFPANLQLVLVLRPTGFFQRTLSDLAFKFNRDDFKMKVPVSMSRVRSAGGTTWVSPLSGPTLGNGCSRLGPTPSTVGGLAARTVGICWSSLTVLPSLPLPGESTSTLCLRRIAVGE